MCGTLTRGLILVIKTKKQKYMKRTEFENQWNRDFAPLTNEVWVGDKKGTI